MDFSKISPQAQEEVKQDSDLKTQINEVLCYSTPAPIASSFTMHRTKQMEKGEKETQQTK